MIGIHHADCLVLMANMKKESVDLIFADPPFNIGYKYDQYDDRRGSLDYLRWCRLWITECDRILKPDGSIYVAIGDEFVADLRCILRARNLRLRNWIVWYYTFGVNCKNKFNRSHAHILYSVKGKKFTFNWKDVRVPSARQTKYNDKRAVDGGKVPDDVWTDSRVCGTFKERTGHPCQMPESILERIIKVSSNPKDLVFDPFCGSGTTAAVAAKLGRRYLSCDISEQYVKDAKKRIEKVLNHGGFYP